MEDRTLLSRAAGHAARDGRAGRWPTARPGCGGRQLATGQSPGYGQRRQAIWARGNGNCLPRSGHAIPPSTWLYAATLENARSSFRAARAGAARSRLSVRPLRFCVVRAGVSEPFRIDHQLNLGHRPVLILLPSDGHDLLISTLPSSSAPVWRTRTFMPAESSHTTLCPRGRIRVVPEPGLAMPGCSRPPGARRREWILRNRLGQVAMGEAAR